MEESKTREKVRLENDGRVVLPVDIMEKYVQQTLGCELWFNQIDNSLGLRLLRGADEPPYIIARVADDSGVVEGVLEAGSFLEKKGVNLGAAPRECLCRYYNQFRLLEIRLGLDEPGTPHGPKGVLDSFPPLED